MNVYVCVFLCIQVLRLNVNLIFVSLVIYELHPCSTVVSLLTDQPDYADMSDLFTGEGWE